MGLGLGLGLDVEEGYQSLSHSGAICAMGGSHGLNQHMEVTNLVRVRVRVRVRVKGER